MQYVYLVIVFFGTWFLNSRAVYLFICMSISLLLTARKFQTPMHICAKTRTYLRRCTHTIFGNLRKTSFCKIWKQLFSKLLWCPWTPQWLHLCKQSITSLRFAGSGIKQGRRQLIHLNSWPTKADVAKNKWTESQSLIHKHQCYALK